MINNINFKLKEKIESFLSDKIESLVLKTVSNTLEINLFWMDREGFLLGFNDALLVNTGLKNHFLEKLGYKSEDQFIGKHAAILGTEEAWLNSQRVMKTGKAMAFEEKQKDADIYYHSIKTPIFDDDNNEVIGLVGISIDITERKRYETELKQARAELQAAQDELLDYKVASKISYKQSLEIYRQLKHENETLKLRLKFGPEY